MLDEQFAMSELRKFQNEPKDASDANITGLHKNWQKQCKKVFI